MEKQKTFIEATGYTTNQYALAGLINTKIASLEARGYEIVSVQVTAVTALVGWVTFRKRG